MQASRLCRGPRRRATRAGRPFLRLRVDASPPSTGRPDVSPRVRREIDSCHYHADSRIRDACVTDDRIVKDAIRADDGSRPGSPPAGPSRPPPGRWPGGEAAARAAPPRTQRTRRRPRSIRERPDPSPAPDGSGAGDVRYRRSLVRRESRSGRPRLRGRTNLGGEPAAAPRMGGTVPTSISPPEGGRIEVLESSLERR